MALPHPPPKPSHLVSVPLITRLERRLSEDVAEPWPEADFDVLAREVFELQFARIPTYRRYCEARGRSPDVVTRWNEVPVVPSTAFKHVELAVSEPRVVFRTSGTTRGEAARGRHLVPHPELYRASLLGTFRAYVMAGRGRLPFVSLIPSPDAAPDSSLSFMVGTAADAFATRVHWVVDADGSVDTAGLRAALRRTAHAREPVLLLGTALAFLHALGPLEQESLPPLAPGSRVMETGGFKGLRTETNRAELRRRLADVLGVPTDRVVNEYGMTELLSQLYEPVLTEGPAAAGVHAAPPWLRVRALDPVSLEELAPGESGLLAFFDLANAGSVAHVLTEDVGSVVAGRVRLQGRAEGAEPRGCSRAMDELMTAAGSDS